MKITPPKISHQIDVTKFFHFQAFPLAKSWLHSWITVLNTKTYFRFTGILWLPVSCHGS